MSQVPPRQLIRACSICGKPVDPAYRPFCSRRCADVDLQRWLSGVYVARSETDEGDKAPPPAAKDED